MNQGLTLGLGVRAPKKGDYRGKLYGYSPGTLGQQKVCLLQAYGCVHP